MLTSLYGSEAICFLDMYIKLVVLRPGFKLSLVGIIPRTNKHQSVVELSTVLIADVSTLLSDITTIHFVKPWHLVLSSNGDGDGGGDVDDSDDDNGGGSI